MPGNNPRCILAIYTFAVFEEKELFRIKLMALFCLLKSALLAEKAQNIK